MQKIKQSKCKCIENESYWRTQIRKYSIIMNFTNTVMVAIVMIFCIYYLWICVPFCVPHSYVCLRVCLCVFANTSVSDDSQDDDNHYEECSAGQSRRTAGSRPVPAPPFCSRTPCVLNSALVFVPMSSCIWAFQNIVLGMYICKTSSSLHLAGIPLWRV